MQNLVYRIGKEISNQLEIYCSNFSDLGEIQNILYRSLLSYISENL